MSRFGLDPGSGEKVLKKTDEKISDSIIPAGFKKFSESEVYNSENLYEKINGKAPLYLDAGFTKLTTQRFINETDETLICELYLYDMQNARNAFSVYSVQKRAEAELLGGMKFGYKSGNAVYFAHGRYYAELIGFSESDVLLKAMTGITNNLKADLPVSQEIEPVELGLFPEQNLIVDSFNFYLTGVFGSTDLTNTFTARYKFDNDELTLFFSLRKSAEDAQNIAEKYYNFLIENGASQKKPANKKLKAKMVDFYDTTEIVFSVDSFIAGVHEAENQELAEKAAIILREKLRIPNKMKNYQ